MDELVDGTPLFDVDKYIHSCIIRECRVGSQSHGWVTAGTGCKRLRLTFVRTRATNWDLVQRGEVPEDFRPMPEVGSGVMEIRVHADSEYRVFYVARYEEAVYVLHCFIKKTQATRKADLDLGRKRYAALIEARKSKSRRKS